MSERPEPVRCGRCQGFVYGPAAGERATILRRVKFHTEADPDNPVCACAQCGSLYEVRAHPAAA